MTFTDHDGTVVRAVGRAIPARYTADQAVYADLDLDVIRWEDAARAERT